ncbi:MAG: family 20 glycosylhydrolase [Bacteroidota bacterium]
MNKIYLLFASAILYSAACSTNRNTQNLEKIQVEVEWKLDSISVMNGNYSYASFTITNHSQETLPADNWSIHYNQIGGKPDQNIALRDMTYTNPAGDYHVLAPTANGPAPGESITYPYVINGLVDKMSEAPKGVFIVLDNMARQVADFAVSGIDIQTLNKANPLTPAMRYQEYQELSLLDEDELLPFIPSPKQSEFGDGLLTIENEVTWLLPDGAEHLQNVIQPHGAWMGLDMTFANETTTDESAQTIRMVLTKVTPEVQPEAYTLDIDGSGIKISATTSAGLMYGAQSTLQMMYAHLDNKRIELPYISVTDAPRFNYRGMHLDVSRNFHSIESIKKILDMMAFYKLNKFHFHLTDDEGWRLEIPDLPELTLIGSRRGYTTTERDHLYPAYGSGPDPDRSYGSGYYTTDEFIDILRYAQDRHIEVIPEIDLPGHARAAIKAMVVKSETTSTGEPSYQLHDPNDRSIYNSAQGYQDNVICLCQEGAYNFTTKVLDELIKMYQTAKVPLRILHIGGDEIPPGAWEGSPICETFLEEQDGLNEVADLLPYFFNFVKEHVKSQGITLAGWEEIMLAHGPDGHATTEINQDMIDGETLPYVWNAVWGWGREDMVYRLANAGSPVIMANSAAFYFDMSYDRDPKEIGLSWSGYADTKTAYSLDPMDMFKTARLDKAGNPLDASYVAGKERLTDQGRKNVIGIQAQLWSETVIGSIWLDYLIYPKLLGFAERAWGQPGPWMSKSSPADVDETLAQEWNKFANTIGQRSLPMLDKIHGGLRYRKPQVGINAAGAKNIQYPGYPME